MCNGVSTNIRHFLRSSIPTHRSLKGKLFIMTKHNLQNVQSKSLFQATKQNLTVKQWKNEMQDSDLFLVELFCGVVLLSSVWKNFVVVVYKVLTQHSLTTGNSQSHPNTTQQGLTIPMNHKRNWPPSS